MEEIKKDVRYVGVKENLLYGLANAGQCFSYNMFTGSFLSLFFIKVFGIPNGALVVRLYKSQGKHAAAALKAGFAYKAAFETDLMEENPVPADPEKLTFRPFEIKTVKFTF